MRSVILIFAALVTFYLYSISLIYGIGSPYAQLDPSWWGRMFSTRGGAVLTWLVLRHTVAVVVVSLPFAFLLRWLYGRYSPTVALAMTLAIFLMGVPLLIHSFADSAIRLKVVTCFDQLKLIGALPLGLPATRS